MNRNCLSLKEFFLGLSLISVFSAGCSLIADAGSGGGGEQQKTITAINFTSWNKTSAGKPVEIQNGQTITVENKGTGCLTYTVTPNEIQNTTSLTWSYDSEIIGIDADRNSVVITGKKSGTTYLKGSANGITATVMVNVEGNPDIYGGEPYITSNTNVVEITPGSNMTVTASLYGGSAEDLEEMVWTIKDPSVATIDYARGSCIVTAKKIGSTQLTVHHPKAEYDFTIVVYVYSDNTTVPYITTAQNIVIINKTERSDQTLFFEVKNPLTENYQRNFTYEAITNDGSEPCFTVLGNGNTAEITGTKTGLSILRVTNSECQYSLDVLVKVTASVKNVYIEPSCTTLEVVGSTTPYNIFADIKGTDRQIDQSLFKWTVYDRAGNKLENSDCMDWTAAGNTFTITGKKNGAFKVKVEHEWTEYARMILVILREQEGSAIDASMYITTTSNYIQTQVGAETKTINVQLMGGEPGDENNLVWTIENGENNDICKIQTPTGKIMSARTAGSIADGTLTITPLKMGESRITVSHPKVLYETEIIVKVLSQYAILEEPVYIDSENSLVKMLNGTQKEITVTLSGKVDSGTENGIVWKSENEQAVTCSQGTLTTQLNAVGNGSHQTYIKASHPKALSEKKILVLTADTQEALDTMKGFYADTTYFRVNENKDVNAEMKQFGLEESDINNIKWVSDNPEICIVGAEPETHLKAKITGVRAGITTVRASLSGCEDCVFNVTVCPEGESTEPIKAKYLTTTKNAVVIGKNGETADISVTGVNISEDEMSNTSWTSEDASIATVNGNGEKAVITATKEGKTRIKVSNPAAQNSIYVNVKVGALYEWSDDFYIYITTENDTVTMVRGETKTIGATLVNSNSKNGFSGSITGKANIAEATVTQEGLVYLEALEAGMTELTIRNATADFEKTVLIVVANSRKELEQIKYLTTEQNVITVGETYNTTVNVKIANASSEILDGYNWTSADSSTAEVIGSGNYAVVYGKKQGSTKITVTNNANCQYPLEMIVNVVDPVKAAENPYIMCTNIVTIHVGDEPQTLTAELVGGTDSDKRNFTWHSKNPETVSIYSSNETAKIRAEKMGTTQIIISHPKAKGIDRTVLVICEPEISNDYYITVNQNIIQMKPTDGTKTINATLVNGNEQDKNNFKWWSDNYDIITMNYSNETCTITPVASGKTTIHCSHPKAPYVKDIDLTISEFTEFAFEQQSVTLTAGKQTFMNMQVPSTNVKTKIRYTVKNTDGMSGNDYLTVSGTNTVCILEPKKEGTCIIYADLLAANSGQVQASAQLLANIQKAEDVETYISFSDSTIINIEKGESKMLMATLSGPEYRIGDENYLKWKSSDPKVVSITPSPSESGWTMNKEVEIKGLVAGKEATITIEHDKAKSHNQILYVIIAGENSASIMLDHTSLNLVMGDNSMPIIATITNAQEDDYKNIEWSVEQDKDNPVISLNGKGKTVGIVPKKVGSAKITAVVPSSKKKATCIVNVEPPRLITFDKTQVKVYPGKSFDLIYTVEPKDELRNVTWSASDKSFFGWDENKISVDDNGNAHLPCYGKSKEGTATLTGTTKSGAKASITIINGWGNSFEISKNMIRTTPIYKDDGTFDIDFKVTPACSEIYVMNLQNTKLRDGTYSEYNSVNLLYKIKPEKFTKIDEQTDTGYGTIRFIPTGECNNEIILEAYNPVTREVENEAEPKPIGVFDSKKVRLGIYHNSYTFSFPDFVSDGNYSRLDGETGILVIGDGETVSFNIRALEENATPIINSVSLVWNGQENKVQELFAGMASTSNNTYGREPWRLKISNDFSRDTKYYGGFSTSNEADNLKNENNTTHLEHYYVGTLNINYSTVYSPNENKYRIPVYLDIRNCRKNYTR